MSCLFCRMVKGEIPAARVHEDDRFFAIRDIRPQAPTHVLVIPKQHIASLAEAFPEKGDSGGAAMVGEMFAFAAETARLLGLLPAGFRSIINTGASAGQTVFHLHLHVLGGAVLGEKLDEEL